jgi:hypothetical protein
MIPFIRGSGPGGTTTDTTNGCREIRHAPKSRVTLAPLHGAPLPLQSPIYERSQAMSINTPAGIARNAGFFGLPAD